MENKENILYYPNEYFNEDIEKISMSFDIWCLGVVFWEILGQNKLIKSESQILDENFIKSVDSPNFCEDIEKFIKE